MDGVLAKAKGSGPVHPAHVSDVLDKVAGGDAMVFSDYGLQLPFMRTKASRSFFGTPQAGGLGWGTGATIGANFGDTGKICVGAMGDGSYMFGNPVPAHQVAAAYDKPSLMIVMNNAMWFAVHRATLGMYPSGKASKANRMPLTILEPSPKFEHLMNVIDGHGERVEDPNDLQGAMERAIKAVKVDKRQALLNVICGADY